MSEKNRKIGIYGGSFDPVHNGHTSLAKDAAGQLGLSKVIFVPTFIQPFKQDKVAAKGEHRYDMLRCATKGDPVFDVSDCEISAGEVSYTYKTLRDFQKQYGEDTELCFICGTDSFIVIESWKNAEEMLTSYSFAVGSRPGYKEKELKEAAERIRKKYGTKINIIDNRQVNVSSSEIREKVSGDCDINGLVCPETEKYILKNGLYK